jgi:hypothetical protein
MSELLPVDDDYNNFLEGERINIVDEKNLKDTHLINDLFIKFNNNAFLNPYSFSQTQLTRLFFWKLKFLEKDNTKNNTKNKIIEISHENNSTKITQLHYFSIIITNLYFLYVLYDYYNLKYFNKVF